VARRLAPCHRVLCASPAYLSERGIPLRPRDLPGHAKIAYAYETERSWRFRTERGEERIACPVRHRANNGQMVIALAREGLGIALLPTFLVADDLRRGSLRALLGDALIGEIGIHAVYPHRKHLSNRVRHLVDFLAEHCGARPRWDEGLPLAGE